MTPLRSLGVVLACTVLGACIGAGRPAGSRVSGTSALEAPWTEADDSVSVTMRSVAEGLQTAGLKPSSIALRHFVSAGERHSFPIALPAHTCATLVAIASAGVADIDAALYAPDGELLGVNAQPDAHPTLQVCALEQPRALYYVLHAYEGAGTVLMVGFIGPHESLEPAARVLGGQPALARDAGAQLAGADRVASFSDAARRRGFVSRGAPLGVPLEAGQPVRVGFGVRAGVCYTVASFAESGLAELALRVLDDEGTELRSSGTAGDSAAAQFCATRNADHTIELTSHAGVGRAQVMVYEAEPSVAGGEHGLWLGVDAQRELQRQKLEVLLEGTLAQARSDGYAVPIAEQRGRLGPGEAQEHAVQLPERGCTRLLVQGGRGIGRLELRARDAAGREFARSVGQVGLARLHLCPPARDLRVQVTALGGGGGQYALLLLGAKGAPSRNAEVSLGTEPDRGSSLELEQQARDAGFTARSEYSAGPRRVDLAADAPEASIGLSLPAGRCLRVYALTRSEGGGPVTARFEHDDQAITARAWPSEPLRVCAEPSASRDIKLKLSAAKQTSVWLWAFERPAPAGNPIKL